MIQLVAEIGINAPQVEQAVKLATIAKECGFDYVKLQKRDPDFAYSPEELAAPCKSPWGTTVRDKVVGRELSWADIDLFNAHCRDIGIGWFASCFDLSSLKELHRRYPTRPYNKIPSSLAIREEYLEAVASQGIPTLVSTGLFKNVDEAVWSTTSVFWRCQCPFGLLHATAIYPAPIERLNLRRMQALDAAARGWLAPNGAVPSSSGELPPRFYLGVGYSGHETGVAPSVVAATLGARWIERHVTLDRTAYGADQAASLEPEGMRRLARDVRMVEEALGESDPALVGDEKVPVKFWREE